MTCSTKAERIAWLAELSAERRQMRRSGLPMRYVVWMQAGQPKARVYFSVADPACVPKRTQRASQKKRVQIDRIFSLIVQLQEQRCYLCGDEMRGPTKEHVVPRAMDGRDYKNLLAAHAQCNAEKADRRPYACETLFLDAINLRLEKLEARARR